MSNYSLSVPSSKIHLCYMRPTTNGVSKINKSVKELWLCVSYNTDVSFHANTITKDTI